MSRSKWISFALPAACLLFLLLAHRVFVYIPDDAFITYRYARNFAQGYGPVFNAGSGERTEGFSCPLFMALMALLSRLPLGIDLLFRAKFLGLLFGLGTLTLLPRLARQVGLPDWAQALAPILLAAFPSFVVGSVDGMETALQTLLVTAAALSFLLEWRHNGTPDNDGTTDRARHGTGVVSALLFALCALNRPEGLVLGLVAAGVLLVGRQPRARTFRWLLTFGLPVALYFLWRHGYYGAWVPNTYYAKQVPLDQALLKGGAYLLRTYFLLLNDNLLFLACAGVWWLLLLVGGASERFRRLPALVLPGVALGQIIFAVRAGGDWMGGWRYMLAVTPILMVLTVAAFVELTKELPQSSRWAKGVFVGGLSAIILTSCALGHRDFWNETIAGYSSWQSRHFTTNPRVLVHGWLLQKAVAVGDWLNVNVRPGSQIAYTEMGLTPYLCPQLHFLDCNGLTDQGVALLPNTRHEQIGVRENYTSEASAVGRYLRDERKPDYILYTRRLPLDESVVAEPLFGGTYQFVAWFPLEPSPPGFRDVMLVWRRAQ